MIKFNIKKYIEKVQNGEANALELYKDLNELENAVKEAKKVILEDALIERAKYPEKTLDMFGYEISVSSSGRYDYSTNPEWCAMDAQRKDLEEKMKICYQTKTTMIDEETGEVIEPATFKASKESLKFKKVKK